MSLLSRWPHSAGNVARTTGGRAPTATSEHKLEDETLLAILAQDMSKKKNNKNKKKEGEAEAK